MNHALALLKNAIPVWTTAPIGAQVELFHRDFLLASPAGQAAAGQAAAAEDARKQRDDLLAQSKAGEHIELVLACTPFAQHPTEPNRNFIRFKNTALSGLGKSGVNTVFLRDHRQRELLARGGTVEKSRMERGDAKQHLLRQTIRLHEPWSVQLALTGSIDRFSIGWNPIGPVTCSVCGTDILAECWHWPGDTVDAGGDAVIVEWIFHAAELLETSAVCVPAVRDTTVDEIRAALAALQPRPAATLGRAPTTRRKPPMSLIHVKQRLGLADDAGEADILAALDERDARERQTAARLAALAAQLDETAKSLAAERAAHEALKARLAAQAEDDFIKAGIHAGKVRPGSQFEKALRALHAMSPDAAKEQIDAAPVTTPVGAPRQSDKPAPPDSGLDELTRRQLLSAGIADPDAYYAKYSRH